MIDLENYTTLEVDEILLESIAKTLTSREFELIITTSDEIQILNKTHRQKDSATDVLSFPLEYDMEHMPLGSIIICDEFVINKAKEYGHSQKEELTLLFIHGLLHLLGYDHEVDEGEHRNKEEELIKKFNLPNSLIVRNS